MNRFSPRVRFAPLAAVAVLTGLCFLAPGCTSEQMQALLDDQKNLMSQIAATQQELAAQKAAATKARQVATTQPANPAADAALAAQLAYIDKLNNALDATQQRLSQVTSTISAVKSGDTAAVGSTVTGVVASTPLAEYAPLAGALAALAYGAFLHFKLKGKADSGTPPSPPPAA